MMKDIAIDAEPAYSLDGCISHIDELSELKSARRTKADRAFNLQN